MSTFERDAIVTNLNKATEELDALTGAEERDTDAISGAVVNLEALRSRLAAHDALNTPATIEAATPEAPKSFGQRAADALVGAPIGTRTLLADPFGDASGAQDVTWAQNNPGIVTGPDAPVRFVDILPVASATSDAVTYIRETGFDNAAAARLAGSNAPESELSFEKVTEPVANIAHFIRVAEETLSDNGALGAVIDRRGISGVRSKVNGSLLAASNATNGVKSVVAAATTKTIGGADELVDAILSAKSDLEALGFAPNTVVLSPANHEAILSAKNEVGTYIGAGPFGGGNGTVWGLRMVVDGALAGGVEAMVCDTAGATLYVRDNADVATDRDIVSNLLTVRVQTRAQLVVEQPEAFVAIVID
jgi:HK97 family phage major capsid protein